MEKPLSFYLKHFAWISALTYAVIFLIIFIFTRETPNYPILNHLIYSNTGEIGDTIGGISSPIIAVIAAGLTFLAFLMQYYANQNYVLQFKSDEVKRSKDAFDKQLETLISQNRKIVESISKKSFDSNRTLECICDELKYSFLLTKQYYCNGNAIPDEAALSISFNLVYYGVGDGANKVTKDLFSNISDLDGLLKMIENVKKMYDSKRWPVDNDKDPIAKIFKLNYRPFDGHQSRLGHYFRSLFHIFSYTEEFGKIKDSQKNRLFTDKDLYNKIKALRTQMSTHEQLLVYLNSQSIFGLPLVEKGYLVKYQIVKNIPLPLIDYISDKPSWFNEIEFEWKKAKKVA